MLTYEEALKIQEEDHNITRIAWKQKNMFLFLVPGEELKKQVKFFISCQKENFTGNYVNCFIRRLDKNSCIPWAVTKEDMDATDWITL